MSLIRLLPIFVAAAAWGAGDGYQDRAELIARTDFAARRAPMVPDAHKKIRLIIDTDAANEIDDLWAIALAVRSPDRLQIEGFVAANFDNGHGGPTSVEQSRAAIELVLAKAGVAGRYPVYRGGAPMRYSYEPSESPGVDFIVARAMASSPADPLWIVGLGAATDLASAYLKEPRIGDRVVFFWHGRTRWPKQCWNFNVFSDRRAATLLFAAPVPFILFDTGTDLTCPMAESAQCVAPCGELGRYLHEFRRTNPWFMQADKGFFDLGDIAALVDPGLGTWEATDCPEVGPDLAYRFTGKKGRLLRCADIDRDRTFRLFYERLRAGGGVK
ncbi:MAG TPA: nucleoside hydrolase [Opitutus sp.]|nr:nucleoside hydrolase [Opitutus sp.]